MFRASLFGCASALALASAAPAFAQTTDAPSTGSATTPDTPASQAATDANDQAPTKGDIIVTALRRSQSILKTPAAITAITGDDLRTKGVNTVSDLEDLVPGVSIQPSQDGINIGIRGVRTTDTSSKGEQDVAFNIDGQYVGRGNARGTAFFDIDRVEVLRGPQGTLYGRSSTGGAVNLITKRPQLGQFSGYTRTEFGNYADKRVEGAINIPLGDVLAFRFAGNLNDREGYTTAAPATVTSGGQTYTFSGAGVGRRNDQKDATGRASLYFQPTDYFSARVTATFGNQKGNGGANQLESYLTGGGSIDDKLRIYPNPVDAFVNNSFFNIDGAVNYRLGGTQLDVTASHQHFHLNQQRPDPQNPALSPDFFSNQPAWGLILLDSPTNTTQVEARVSNVDPARIDYVVGGNYFYEVSDEKGHVYRAPIASGTNTATYAHFFEVFNHTFHRAFGVFGQGTFHLNDQLSFVGGIRWTKDTLERSGYIVLPFQCFGKSYPDTCGGGIPNAGGSSDKKITYRAGINYQANPDNLIYASVATGFKGGGFNDFSPQAANPFTPSQYDPSSLTAYEIGYKGRPVANLTLASDVFYYDFAKNQINASIEFPALGQGSTGLTIAVPTEIYGIENEFSYQLTPLTFFSGTASYQRSRYRDFLAGGIAGDQIQWRGLDLDQVPRFVATAALEHGIALANDARLSVRGQLKYSSHYYLSDIANAVRYKQKGFTRSDLNLTYAAPEDRYSIQLFVENIENKVQRQGSPGGYTGPYGGTGGQTKSQTIVYPKPGDGTIPAQPFGYLQFATSTPRFYGIRLNSKF